MLPDGPSSNLFISPNKVSQQVACHGITMAIIIRIQVSFIWDSWMVQGLVGTSSSKQHLLQKTMCLILYQLVAPLSEVES